MFSKQKVCLILIPLLCCILLVSCTQQDATPQWWWRTEIEFAGFKEPLMRLMAFSIPWCWVTAIAIYIVKKVDPWSWIAEIVEEVLGDNFWVFASFALFSPLLLWFVVFILSVILNVIFIPLLAYGITGAVYSFYFDFLFFCTLAIIVAIPMIVLLIFFVNLLQAEDTIHRFFGGFAIIAEIVGIIFTIRDILRLLGD